MTTPAVAAIETAATQGLAGAGASVTVATTGAAGVANAAAKTAAVSVVGPAPGGGGIVAGSAAAAAKADAALTAAAAATRETAKAAAAAATASTVVESIVAWSVVAGSVIPYAAQYVTTRRSGEAGAFSTIVCFLLLASSQGRIIYWILKPYAIPLLVQSVVMIVVQFALLAQHVQLRSQKIKDISLWDFKLSQFWQWTSLTDYVTVLLAILGVFSALGYLFGKSPVFVELLGMLSLVMESMIGIPQLSRIHKRRSAAGVSFGMIGGWLVGDAFKAVYFAVGSVPKPFFACAVIQLLVDAIIVAQIIRYSKSTV